MGKNENKSEKKRLEGFQLASSQSCNQAIWAGGLFFFKEKTCRIAHGICTRDTRDMHTWHTVHGTQRAHTWMIMYPKSVPAQGTQFSGKPCRFQRDTND